MSYIRLTFLLSFITFFGACAGHKSPNNSDASNDDLLSMAEKAVFDNDIPALAVAIIRDGKVVNMTGFGKQHRKTHIAIDNETIFQIGSLTKMFTGIVVKHMVDEGKLALDANIVSYLPATISSQASQILKHITIQDLIHHRSGIPGWALNNGRIDGDSMLGGYSEMQLLEGLDNIKLKFSPGSKLAYSNSGYAILGYICERVSGQSYAQLVKKYITQPYGLNNTKVSLNKEQQRRMATPYRKDDRVIATQPWEMGKITPAGGLFSNTENLSRLMLAQLSAYQNTKSNSDLFLTKITNEFYGENTFYGYGLVKRVLPKNTDYSHGGDLDGFASNYRFSPEANVGLILLTSSGGKWIGELEAAMFDLLLKQVI